MIEVLKQALEALEDVGVLTDREWQAVHKNKANELRQAIAELESQEPVAWRFKTGTWWNREVHWRYVLSLDGTEGLLGLEPLYTHPPQRTWVGLTDEEIWQIATDSTIGGDLHADKFAKAIESKLKERNG